MILPDLEKLDNLSNKEVANFWFDYWQLHFPIDGLTLKYKKIEDFVGYADYENKLTVFDEVHVTSNRWKYYSTARHEHVHHLLSKFGKNTAHTLLFTLVDGALELAFEKLRGHRLIPLETSVRFYDFYQDRIASKQINTRLVRVLSKRLSRYVNDIEKLIDKADKYAHSIRETVPTKIFNLSLLSDKHWDREEVIFNQWTESNDLHLAEMCKAREEIKKLKADLSYTNSLNIKWQSAFICLVIAVTWIGSRA
jgi:hypothetical protein